MHALHYSLPYPRWEPEPLANDDALYQHIILPVALVEREKVTEKQNWKHTHMRSEK